MARSNDDQGTGMGSANDLEGSQQQALLAIHGAAGNNDRCDVRLSKCGSQAGQNGRCVRRRDVIFQISADLDTLRPSAYIYEARFVLLGLGQKTINITKDSAQGTTERAVPT